MSNSKFRKPSYSGTLSIGGSMPALRRFRSRGAQGLTGVDLGGCTRIEEIDLRGCARFTDLSLPAGAPVRNLWLPSAEMDGQAYVPFNLSLKGLEKLRFGYAQDAKEWKSIGGYVVDEQGGSYFDTGVAFDAADTRIEVKAEWGAYTVYERGAVIIGTSRWTWDGNSMMLQLAAANDLRASCGNDVIARSVEAGKPCVVAWDKAGLYVDGKYVGKNWGSRGKESLWILGHGSGDRGRVRIYYVKIWKLGVLERDLWPAVDRAGRACLYDYVSDEYLHAAGNGVLKPSGEVTQENATASVYKDSGLEIGRFGRLGTVEIAGCPHVDGFAIASEAAMDSDSALRSVDIEIGDRTGGLAPLLALAKVGTLTDAEGRPVTDAVGMPLGNGNVRVRGTYTLDGYVPPKLARMVGVDPQAGVAQPSTVIRGLTVALDRAMDEESILLQSYAPEEAGWNPAACCLLQQAGFGSFVDDADPSLGWYMTKGQAAAANVAYVFGGAVDVRDAYAICAGSKADGSSCYEFVSLLELEHFAATQFSALLGSDKAGVRYCTKLKRVRIPPSVTELGAGRARFPFFEGADLSETPVEVFDNVEVIGGGVIESSRRGAFAGTNIAWTRLPKRLRELHADAFYNCKKLALTELPSTLTYIGDASSSSFGAFGECIGLALTSLPEGLTYIGSSAFRNCSGIALTSLSEGLAAIGDRTFEGCANMTIAELPSGVRSIGAYAFRNCSGIALTSLPEGLAAIGDSTFEGCANMTIAELPSGVRSIGAYAFNGCAKLALTALPEGVESIGAYAFNGCAKLALTALPSGVKSIGDYAFDGCTGIALARLPEGVAAIGSHAFDGCTGCFEADLAHPFVWPKALTSLGRGAFQFTAMRHFEPPASLTGSVPTFYDGVRSSEGVTMAFHGGFSLLAGNASETIILFAWLRSATPLTLTSASALGWNRFGKDRVAELGPIFVGQGKSMEEDLKVLADYRGAANWSSDTNESHLSTRLQPLASLRQGIGLESLSFFQGDLATNYYGSSGSAKRIFTSFLTEGAYMVATSGSVYVSAKQQVALMPVQDRWDLAIVNGQGEPNVVNFARYDGGGALDVQYYYLTVPAGKMARLAFKNGTEGSDPISPASDFTSKINITRQ